MVNRYANGPEELDENRQGPYVLATDYAALEAERDEWKRRCERYEERAGKAVRVPDPYTGGMRWDGIAEGRDNG